MPVDRPLAGPGVFPAAGEAARSVFSKFRALLEANTAALAVMAGMERMRGGDYIFDRAFLEQAAREVAEHAHQAVYTLNAMTGNRHVALYDRFMAIAAAVEDILAGRPGPDDDRLARPLDRLRLEDRPKAGQAGAALGELAGQLGLPVPRGFAVTRAAWRDRELAAEARLAIADLLADPDTALRAPTARVTVSLTGADGTVETREKRGVPAETGALVATLKDCARTGLAGSPASEVAVTAVVAALPPALARGSVWTAWPGADSQPLVRVAFWPDDDPTAVETLSLERAHPYAITPSPAATAPSPRPARRPLLSPETATELAARAMAAERLFAAPLELQFCLETSGTLVFESAALGAPPEPAAFPDTAARQVLAAGGEAACLGAASGRVVLVEPATPAAKFPLGAIAVARSASPALAPVLRRAGAMVTEVGDAAGHLAAVAREFRVPALFGLPDALGLLPPGELVSVDADAGKVFRGGGAARPAAEGGLTPDDPEYLLLRRLLRRVAVLNLTDPQAPDFTVDGCHTLHDVLHFAHEQAVTALADLRQVGVNESLARPLRLPVPLDLRVLDIGGGLAPGGADLGAVRSRPLAALLAGLTAPGMWDTTPARIGLGDMLGAMTRPLPETTANLAIAARSYCNVSLRLGWHFTVIDAYIDRRIEKNVIAFRFVGGLANAAGREARAEVVRRILARQGFKVEVAGDLVVARLKLVEAETAEAALRLLGGLCAFARQRDTAVFDAGAAEALARAFGDAWRAAQGDRP